jgi:GT2 family glycosyltransferase
VSPRVVVTLVTRNSAPHLDECLESLSRQSYRDLEIRLWDNASTDETLEIAGRRVELFAGTHFGSRNLGFSAAHNRLIAESSSDYVLVFNPDVVLEPAFVSTLVEALDADATAGSASGKLWRLDGKQDGRILDTTGIYFTPNQRHFDRGSGEPDRGRYDRREYVFGASGAAAFYRRAMLEQVRAGEEYFDEAFFAYREDADLAWRAQWLGWRCLYVPEARGRHVRRVLPERRSALPADINMHSFKNRFLMRVKNMDAGTYARFFAAITARDVAAFAYVLARERTSLRALPLFWAALPRALALRRALRRHRRVTPREMRRWFAWKPVSFPVTALEPILRIQK